MHRSICGKAGMKPFVSIADAIGNIPPGTPDHAESLANYHSYGNGGKRSYSESSALHYTIHTKFSHWYPSGKRGFTVREVACLQGFPLEHQFAGNAEERRRQIGNAVPPPISQRVLDGCIKALMITDGILPNGTSIPPASFKSSLMLI